jgi:hypothetical protein
MVLGMSMQAANSRSRVAALAGIFNAPGLLFLAAGMPVVAQDGECNIPLVQNEFVSFIAGSREEHYRTNFANREYALNLENLVLKERSSEASFILPNGDFNKWYAVLRHTVELNDEQVEVIQASLEVGPYLSFRLQFHNEIFGDSFDTRVPVDSPLGVQVSAILEGTEVIISGQFVRNDEEILEISVTPADGVTHPAYLVELREIREVGTLTDCMDTLRFISPNLPETPPGG